MKEPLKPIPDFASEAEERTFRKNDSTEYVDWTTPRPVIFSKLPPSTEAAR